MAKHDKTIEYVGDSRVPAKRMPNIAPSYAEFPGKSEAFWPNFLLKEWMVAAVVLIAFLILTISHPSPLEAKADPNNASYIPLPDWYFLFLYQLLKYPWQSGNWVVFGVVIVPGIAFGALVLAPWLDTSPERKPSKRPVATGIMLLSIVSIFYLTWAAIDEHNRLHPKPAAGAGGAAAAKPPADFKADEIWTKQASCQGCHGGNMEGVSGPPLWNVGGHLDEKAIHDVIVNGRGAMPKGMFNGSPEELDQLVKYLASLKGDGKGDAAGGGGTSTPATEEKKPEGGEADKGGASATAPTGGTAEEGKTMASSQCLSCHGQNLEGGIGPSLAGVVDRLKPEGVVEVLKNGRGGMPPLGAGWSDQQMSSMIEYLTTVK